MKQERIKKLTRKELYTGYNPSVREARVDERLGALPWGQYCSVCEDVRDPGGVSEPANFPKWLIRQCSHPETKSALAVFDKIEKRFVDRLTGEKSNARRRIRSQMIEAGRLIVHAMSALRSMEDELGAHLDDCDIAVLEAVAYFLREK